MKVVINACFGGFGLSKEAYKFLKLDWDSYGFKYDDDRSNPKLIECVEKLREEANGSCAELKVVVVPDDIEWEIEEYDGFEHVAEKHRIWE